MSIQSKLIRSLFAYGDWIRDRGLAMPVDLRVTKQLHYGPERKWHRFELYRPATYTGRLPVIVNVHGGAYVYGSTKLYRFYCMNLAEQHYAVFNFNYRLAALGLNCGLSAM